MSVWQRNGFIVIPKITSPSVTGATVNGRAGVSEINGQTVVLDSETQAWITAVSSAVGTIDTQGVSFGSNLAAALRGQSYSSKIVYLVAFFGTNLQACICPLRNTLSVASMGISGAGTATCSQAAGLHGDGAVLFTLRLTPSQIGTGANGGFGYWENNVDFTGTSVEPMGCYGASGASRFILYATAIASGMCWGNPANLFGTGSAFTNGHWYAERSSSTLRTVYKNGASAATNTASDAAAGTADNAIYLLGSNEFPSPVVYWKGRCAVVYLTDGTLSSGDASSLHTLLLNYVFTPTGRPSS